MKSDNSSKRKIKSNSAFLLIPSAKVIPEELQNEFGKIPHCLLPFGNNIVLQHIVNAYEPAKWRVILGYHEGASALKQYEPTFENRVEFIDVGGTQSLGETILRMIDSVVSQSNAYHIRIHLADTVLPVKDKFKQERDVVYYQSANQLYRWTSFDNINGLTIFDKKEQHRTSSKVFVGVFQFSKGNLFRNLLLNAVNPDHSSGIDPFYEALRKYHEKKPLTFVLSKKWFDLGHIDNYYSARKEFLNTRVFNTFLIDGERNVLIKKSRNHEKFRDEIQWYLSLPPRFQYLTPRIYSHSLKKEEEFVELEYYGYPNLGELYLFSNLDDSIWYSTVDKLLRILKDLHSNEVQLEQSEVCRRKKEMYLTKTCRRLEMILQQEAFSSFCENNIAINGKQYHGLMKLYDMLPQIISDSDLTGGTALSIVHGDFCLSNILYDTRNRIIKLIDPRGSFGEKGIYGDSLYDYAKLIHSFDGGYEFVINNRYWYKATPSNIEFRILFTEKNRRIQQIFDRLLRKQLDWQRLAQVKLIEALLFLSMVPLHHDDEMKQKVMLAQGIMLLNNYVQPQ